MGRTSLREPSVPEPPPHHLAPSLALLQSHATSLTLEPCVTELNERHIRLGGSMRTTPGHPPVVAGSMACPNQGVAFLSALSELAVSTIFSLTFGRKLEKSQRLLYLFNFHCNDNGR
ncbi:hypothetical protein RRG08_020859 [Elysia crispata]|uniref:Uncharacterized protein n=1 Tax=Elysia crispata TaxID=231223 RepID=A0AAE0XVA7_9GAST|nr:hypothetical protein RRG08_020859 [Elysia crispata]